MFSGLFASLLYIYFCRLNKIQQTFMIPVLLPLKNNLQMVIS